MAEMTQKEQEEFQLLLARANTLGLSVHPKIGLATLREKVANAVGTTEESDNTNALRETIHSEAMKLVRCAITNLDPSKSGIHGEFITVANEYIGSVTKFIPFGEAGQSYHIPNCIYEALLEREFQVIRRVKIPNTNKERIEYFMTKEYNIQVLPQLTPEELQNLALKQAAADPTV